MSSVDCIFTKGAEDMNEQHIADAYDADNGPSREDYDDATIEVGSWVYTDRGADADYGQVIEVIDEQTVVVAWRGSEQSTRADVTSLYIAADQREAREGAHGK